MDSIFKVKTPYTNHPYISCCLKVGYCERFGRFLFASKQLKAGEILVLEEPFFYSMDIKDDVLLKRCAFCVKVCKYEPLMCPTCNNSTYCSEECFNKSLHMLECSLVGKADKDDGYFLLMTRMLMKSINICGSLENLQKFIECRNKNLTLLDTLDNDFGKLNSCFNLESGNLKQDLKFSKSFVKSDNVKFLYKNDDQKFFLVKIILRILGILNRNSFSIEFSDGNRCGAVFPFASLINHSCSPNIERVSFGKQTAFVSIRPIEKNEQIFICYRRYFYDECDYKLRRQEIFDQFNFLCQCEACIDPDHFCKLQKKQEIQDFRGLELQRLLHVYENNCVFITSNIKKYPCFGIINKIAENLKILQHLADAYEN